MITSVARIAGVLALIAAFIYFLWLSRPRHRVNKAARIYIVSTKQLNVGASTPITILIKDKAGDVVVLPTGSVPTWSVDQVALASLDVAADGLSATATGLAAGLATITVTAEGDPVAGVDTVTGTGTLNIVDEAASLELVFGDAPAPEPVA